MIIMISCIMTAFAIPSGINDPGYKSSADPGSTIPVSLVQYTRDISDFNNRRTSSTTRVVQIRDQRSRYRSYNTLATFRTSITEERPQLQRWCRSGINDPGYSPPQSPHLKWGEEVRVKTKAVPASPTYTRSEILEEEGDTVLWRLWRRGWTFQSGVSTE